MKIRWPRKRWCIEVVLVSGEDGTEIHSEVYPVRFWTKKRACAVVRKADAIDLPPGVRTIVFKDER